MLAGAPILVEVSHGETRAAIRRDAEGRLWISLWHADRPDRVAGTQLRGAEPGRIGGVSHTAVGGALAPGAVRARVRDADGAWHEAAARDGAWVAFVPWPQERPGAPAVRFHDAGGEPVSRADPALLAAARPLDSRRLALLEGLGGGLGGDCPACGARAWVAAPAPDPPHPPAPPRELPEHIRRAVREGRAMHGPQPGPVVIFCSACGHADGGVHGFYGASAAPPGA